MGSPAVSAHQQPASFVRCAPHCPAAVRAHRLAPAAPPPPLSSDRRPCMACWCARMGGRPNAAAWRPMGEVTAAAGTACRQPATAAESPLN